MCFLIIWTWNKGWCNVGRVSAKQLCSLSDCMCRSKLADGASVLAEAQQALGLSHVQEAYQVNGFPLRQCTACATCDRQNGHVAVSGSTLLQSL